MFVEASKPTCLRFQDPNTLKYYWWHNVRDEWFWEGDPAWARFCDPESKRLWWFKEENGEMFWC